MSDDYLSKRRAFIEADRPLKKKKSYYIPKKSARRKTKEEALAASGGDNAMDLFFEAMRKRMVGVCQCGCGRKSSKLEDDFYRASICHIFPKAIFKSIANHELNWVERNFWDGCHANMDNQSIEKWTMFADWEDIKERFYILAPLLTEQERGHKFYALLEALVYKKQRR